MTTTIAKKYINVLTEHRGRPGTTGTSRELSKYVDDPYNMSRAEYQSAKKRIKADYKEKSRAVQKKLTRKALGAVRRKPQQWLSNREKRKELLADLETKFKRSEIDRKYGNVPGPWREDERGRYPVGTQGVSKARRRAINRPKNTGRTAIPAPKYDVDADYYEVPEPYGYLAPPRAPLPPMKQLPPPSIKPKQLRPPRRLALPQASANPRVLGPNPVKPLLPAGRRPPVALLPVGTPSKVSKTANRIRKRRGSRR